MFQNLNMKYRRQFVASFKPSNEFLDWQHIEYKEERFHIYAHPDLGTSSTASREKNIKLTLLGFVIDPENPHKNNKKIIDDLVEYDTKSIEAFSNAVSILAGRFVLILSMSGQIYIYHDPCGLRSVYFTSSTGYTFIGSQPLLFSKFFDLKTSEHYNTFYSSKHFIDNVEYWLPSGMTLYEKIHHLVPNHYLDVTKVKQVRYWPTCQIVRQDFEKAVQISAGMLVKLISSAKLRFSLALPLTSGYDSRVLLAASKNYIDQIYVYTLMYRDLTTNSEDVKIPNLILNKNMIKHHVIECRDQIDPEFLTFYNSIYYLAHNDWASILFGMLNKYPQDRINVKGNCSEITRCFYYKYGTHDDVISPRQLAGLEHGWNSMQFIVDSLDEWLKSVIKICEYSKIDILDLFYWEHRMGSWQAQGQLEWDIVQEAFTPYNYRPLLTTMLGTPIKYRTHKDYLLYQQITNYLWPELLKWPINRNVTGRDHIIYLLKKIGAYEQIRKQYRFLKSISIGGK